MGSTSTTCSCKSKHELNHSCEHTIKNKQEKTCCSSSDTHSDTQNKVSNEHHHTSCTGTEDDGEDDSDSAHSSGGCCGHEHVISPLSDISPINDASDTRAVYRIMKMDCPMEEALIRKKLLSIEGIIHLEFNLMQRILTVDHELTSTEPIIAALKSIDMRPEPISNYNGVTTVFSVNGMDCPVEENLIRSKLATISGIFDLEFNLIQRTLKINHETSALSTISEALFALNMDAKLLNTESGECNPISAPKIPWGKLAIAGIAAGLSETFELINEWEIKPFGLNLKAWTIGSIEVVECLPLIFAVIAIVLAGLTTYKKGWLAVKNFNLNINALMSWAVS